MEKMLRYVLACGLLTLVSIGPVQAQTDKPSEWTPEEKELADKATKLNNEASWLLDMEKAKAAAEKLSEALEIRRKLYSKERFPDGHLKLAESLNNLGFVLYSLGDAGKAVSYHEQALAMYQKLYSKDRYPDGHPDLAASLNNLGFVLQSLGESSKALPYYEQALAMKKQLYPKELYEIGHQNLAIGLNNMGFVLQSLGEFDKALPYFEQALAMYQGLFPKELYKDGHPELARSLNNLGYVLYSLGEYRKAFRYTEQALTMKQRLYTKELYKDGHPELAESLNNMAFVLDSQGQSDKGLQYHEQALAMRQRLYPKESCREGHPELARSLNNMGSALGSQGEYRKALPYHEQALAMNRQLYPTERFQDGHPELARSLHNLGSVLSMLGEANKALACYEQALAMNCKLGMRQAGQSSEAQALAYGQQQPPTRNLYLSVAVRSSSVPRYPALWSSRGGILLQLQARHQGIAALTRQPGEVKNDYEELIHVRQELSRLQSVFPRGAEASTVRNESLAKFNDEQDRLERKLAAALPKFKHLKELGEKGPADLAKELPKNAAFVDCIRYWHSNEKKELCSWRYVAFVVLPGMEPKFLQLGDAKQEYDAKPIDDAIAAWRKHIDAGENSLAPAKLRELVWDKIAKELPPETKIVYLCPDGDLARMPFAALPGAKKGTILLEDYALAVVPSGQWLLQQFLYPPKPSEAPDRVLAVGDISYGNSGDPSKPPYPALPATGRELKRVLEAFGQQSDDCLSGEAATTEAIRQQLGKVRYAHFATHGYFDQEILNAQRKRLQKSLEEWTLQTDDKNRLVLPRVRNEALCVGLVFAGANAPDKAGPDRGILNGLNVVDLPLENLRLCVLSACETGLGELTEGEGVMGLQRAFHAAGCPNVVGSLWQVNDEATAALMTQFYHELRVKKRSPLEALREAQLTLYRHPERIPALAGNRGKIQQEETVKSGSAAPETKPGETAKTTPVKLWAAFVLSGVGL